MDWFDIKDNYRHVENVCGILVRKWIVFAISQCNILIKGTLATIYRQRGSLRDCEAVLDVELEVLIRLTRSSEGASAQQVCSQIC